MTVNWKTVKARLQRRKVVNVELPVLTESEVRIDREADLQRRTRLGLSLDDGDRHEVRDRYREIYGDPWNVKISSGGI
jgi:hypothetical protein